MDTDNEPRDIAALAKEMCKASYNSFVSIAKSEWREARRACLQHQVLSKALQEVVTSNKMELPLLGVPVYHNSILKEDKVVVAHKVSQNIIQAWHKIQQVTKDLPSPPVTEDSQVANTSLPWSQYDQLLISTIANIQVLIDEHLLKEDSTERNYATSHADAVHLKINLLANEVLLLTYQRLQILALKQIQTSLISAKSQLQNELNTASQMLAMYDSAAGSEFSSLAQEYRQILAEITHKQWALSELATSK